MRVVLVEPEIPPNTGNIARLCAATKVALHLVGPLGFELSDRTLKRAGMDYWQWVDWTVWPDWTAFSSTFDPAKSYLLSKKARRSFLTADFRGVDTLIFGRESKGLPERLLQTHAERSLRIPMREERARSLNLGTSVAIVLTEALRQQDSWGV